MHNKCMGYTEILPVFSQYATDFEVFVNLTEWKVSKGVSKLKVKVLGADRISIHFEPFGERNILRVLNELQVGKEKPVMGNIEPLLGIAKPAEGLN